MTKQCREVLAECDFGEESARDIETFVSRCTVQQVVNLIWSKDKKGIREAKWFAPFFDRGYVKSTIQIQCSFDRLFWEAYDWLSRAIVEDFSVFDFPLIDEMARNTKKMKIAFGKSRIRTIAYIHAVFKSIEDIKSSRDNTDQILNFEIGHSKENK